MERVSLNVEGMSCEHCVKAINSALGELEGISEVDVNLVEKTVTVEYDNSKITIEKIKEAIDEEGYEVV